MTKKLPIFRKLRSVCQSSGFRQVRRRSCALGLRPGFGCTILPRRAMESLTSVIIRRYIILWICSSRPVAFAPRPRRALADVPRRTLLDGVAATSLPERLGALDLQDGGAVKSSPASSRRASSSARTTQRLRAGVATARSLEFKTGGV